MLVLGIAPGLDALAYSVVWWKDDGDVIAVDTDILRCRPLSLEGKRNPEKRSRVHMLVLSVVAERFPPTHHSWLSHDLPWMRCGDGLPGYAESRPPSAGDPP